MRNIRQNLFVAFLCNMVGSPAAPGVRASGSGPPGSLGTRERFARIQVQTPA